jgi:hypothetical protein
MHRPLGNRHREREQKNDWSELCLSELISIRIFRGHMPSPTGVPPALIAVMVSPAVCAIAQTPSSRAANFNSMDELDRQASQEVDVMEVVKTPKERGLAYLWQAITEQIGDIEAMRAHVTLARALLGDGRTCTRLLK